MSWRHRRNPRRHRPKLPLPQPLREFIDLVGEEIAAEVALEPKVINLSQDEMNLLEELLGKAKELGDAPYRVVVEEVVVEEVITPNDLIMSSLTVEPVPQEEHKDSIVMDHDDASLPTVEVKIPEEMPQIVEASLESVEPVINTASEDAQIVIDVTDAKHEVSDDVELSVVKTEAGKSDVVVAVKKKDKEAAEAAGVDMIGKVKEAVEASLTMLPAPDLPAAEETSVVSADVEGKEAKVEVPEVTTQVVEAKVEKDEENKTVVKLEDVSENIPENAELVPVVTAEGEHDIVVAVAPEAKAELDAAGVDVAADVGKALVDNVTVVEEAPVAPAEDVPAESPPVEETESVEVAEEAPAVEEPVSDEPVAEEVQEEASEPASEEASEAEVPSSNTDTVESGMDDSANTESANT